MANAGPSHAGGGTNILIVGVSVLLVAALMAWLVMQQPDGSEAVVAEGDTTGAVVETAAVAPQHTVDGTAFEQNMRSYVGQVVALNGVRFSSGLSRQTFWLELPSGAPYLVKLDSAMVAAGTTPPAGGTLDIVGTVKEKDAALVAQWLQSRVLETEDQQMQAEFGTTYLEARQIRPAAQ